MPSQTGRNYRVAFKVQAEIDTLPGATGATRLRTIGSPGLNENSDPIMSEEDRADLQQQQGRMGARSTGGTFEVESSLGSHDAWIEAFMRANAEAAATIDETDVGQITISGSAITAASGSWLTEGVRVGDVVTLSGTTETANHALRLRVVSVTATVLTVADTLTAMGTASDFDLVRHRRIVSPATVVRRLFTVEQYMADIDASELFVDCRVSQLSMNATANAMKRLSFGLVGRQMQLPETAPYFTDPTATTSIPLVTVDGSLRFDGEDVAVITGFTLDGNLNAQTVPVVGSRLSPDVYDNKQNITASITSIREDLSYVTKYLAEEELEMQLMFYAPGTDPRAFMSLYMGNVKLQAPQKQLGGDGPMIQTVPLMVGVRQVEADDGYEETTLKWVTSYDPA